MLLFGGYKLLDGMAKWIMSALTIATVAAVIIAAIKHPEYSADFVEKHHGSLQPFHLSFHFLDGCQHQLKFQPLTHFGQLRKSKTVDFNTDDALFDFNVGYIGTAILAVFFVALGLLFSIQLVSQ